MSKILVIRFSALGDVAMTVPVLFSFARQYPQHQLVVLSRKQMGVLYKEAPQNITFRGVDLKNDYKGIKGLARLYSELKEEKFDAIADLHDVLRSKFLRWRFLLSVTKVAHIDKGRKGKRKLTSLNHKVKTQQATSFKRYTDVLLRLGFPFKPEFKSIYPDAGEISCPAVNSLTGEKNGNYWVGIAPFAAHQGKIYPIELQEEVIRSLSADSTCRVFLFGGGAHEKEILNAWEKKYPNVISVAGKLKMDEELVLMSRLDVMESMDSGNMHLASLVGTPVVSIWGATHPYAGFMGWGQSESNAIQVDLPCRPCSIYGNKPCAKGNYECLRNIRPETIVSRIKSIAHNR